MLSNFLLNKDGTVYIEIRGSIVLDLIDFPIEFIKV